jgi:hypothetical protein
VCASVCLHQRYYLFQLFAFCCKLCGKGHFTGEQGDDASISYLTALISLVRKHQRDYFLRTREIIYSRFVGWWRFVGEQGMRRVAGVAAWLFFFCVENLSRWFVGEEGDAAGGLWQHCWLVVHDSVRPEDTLAYVRISQHTSAYVSICQHSIAGSLRMIAFALKFEKKKKEKVRVKRRYASASTFVSRSLSRSRSCALSPPRPLPRLLPLPPSLPASAHTHTHTHTGVRQGCCGE